MTEKSGSSSKNSFLSTFQALASTAGAAATKLTQQGSALASQAADQLGLKDNFQATEKAAMKFAQKGGVDARKAANKLRRLASRALDFEDDDESIDTLDFDMLLSSAGAIQKTIAMRGIHSQTYELPAGSGMVWKARVKKLDIGFIVRELHDGSELSRDTEAIPKYKSDQPIQGELTPASRNRKITITFDNTHTLHQRKIVAYWVEIGEKVSLADTANSSGRSKESIAAEVGPSEP
jgi:hypothetical protein